MKRLSIIVPVYNGSKRITKCLQSIFAQTYHQIELIVLDDGSTDDSYKIVQSYIEENKPEWLDVSVVTKENQGVAKTRNEGVQIAKGEYVAFIDQDDYIMETYCQDFMEIANDNSYDIILGGYERVTDNKVIRHAATTGKEWDRYSIVAPWGRVFRKDFLLENNISFLSTYIGEDIYFNMVAYSYTNNIYCIKNNAAYKWYYNLESVSNSKQNKISKKNNPLYFLNKMHEDFAEDNCIPFRIREYFCWRFIIWFLLFTFRNSTKKDLYEMMDKLYVWIDKQYPSYLKNRYILISPKGESLGVHLSVIGVTILRKLKLDKFVLGLFAKNS